MPVSLGLIQRNQRNAGMQVLVGQHARQEGNTQARADQVDDKVDLGAAHGNFRRDAPTLAGGKNDAVQGKPGLEQYEG